ncbi:IS256 family transposase [Kallipyga gabonensis]|uniref:IS256 family transposase n=1 Tax=Kallipyga gabonensis TaxID=1686287 RepID=UPI000A9E393C|nr:IS256 family transposase [Kallipyga gabonensis]
MANGDSLKELFRSQVEIALNMLMQTERTAFLGYEPWDPAGYHKGNRRNGFCERTLKTEIGELKLQIPRDRLGLFEQRTINTYLESQDNLEQSIILLYRKGISTRKISDLIEKMYGHYYSAQTISNMSQIVEEEIALYKQRPVKRRYTALFRDATFINVRRDTVAKEALHVIIGIDELGYKEVLSFEVYPTEAAVNYREMLENLKQRGLEEVLLFVSDELTGLSSALIDSFLKARHQSCWTHLLRNTSNKIKPRDKDEVLRDLKLVYKAKDKLEAEAKLSDFAEKWQSKYPKVTAGYQAKDNIFSFLDFPETIRPSLYTNNVSENFNKQLKRRTKVKEQFPSEDALEKASYCYVGEYNAKFGQRIHKGFKLAQFQITELFEEIYGSETGDKELKQKISSPMGMKNLLNLSLKL